MKHITTIAYHKMDFVFISDHWDLHLVGTCFYEGNLCYFKTLDDDFEDEIVEDWETVCEIFALTFLEKIYWRWQQKKFEWMVGYHWTYPLQGKRFYYRTPVWFYKFLFRLFYKQW
jgi:hypothetical protein